MLPIETADLFLCKTSELLLGIKSVTSLVVLNCPDVKGYRSNQNEGSDSTIHAIALQSTDHVSCMLEGV